MRLSAVLVLLLAWVGCGPSAETVERDALVARIEALRDIPAEDTSARARASEELARMPATGPVAIAARDRCAKAFGTLAEGMRLTSLAESGVHATSSADAAATLRATLAATHLLESANTLLDQCADAAAALRLKQ
ncbi:MAG: hypothetical protein U0414_00595 [Polyangiaceae bacterium]